MLNPEYIYSLVESNNLQEVHSIIKNSFDVNYQNESGETLLMRASSCGHLEIVKLLVENGANVDLLDLEGDVAFTYASNEECWAVSKYLSLLTNSELCELIFLGAAIEGDVTVLEILLDAEISVDCRQRGVWHEKGMTALMLAAQEGEFIAVKKLLAYQANPNLLDEDTGKSAIMFAVESGSLEIVKLIARSGANLSSQDKQGNTSLKKATALGNTAISNFLESAER